MRSVHGVARYVGRARGWCGRLEQYVGAGTEGCGLHARSSAARISVQSVQMNSETSASCKSWPHPFIRSDAPRGGMDGGWTGHRRHGHGPGRTDTWLKTCNLYPRMRSATKHVSSLHGIARLPLHAAVQCSSPISNHSRTHHGQKCEQGHVTVYAWFKLKICSEPLRGFKCRINTKSKHQICCVIV